MLLPFSIYGWSPFNDLNNESSSESSGMWNQSLDALWLYKIAGCSNYVPSIGLASYGLHTELKHMLWVFCVYCLFADGFTIKIILHQKRTGVHVMEKIFEMKHAL